MGFGHGCRRSASPSSEARSARAARTVAIDRSMSPETQNSYTVTSASMFGEI